MKNYNIKLYIDYLIQINKILIKDKILKIMESIRKNWGVIAGAAGIAAITASYLTAKSMKIDSSDSE